MWPPYPKKMKNRSVTKHIPKDYLNTGLAAVSHNIPYEEASSLPIHSVQAVETKNGKKEFHIKILQTKSY